MTVSCTTRTIERRADRMLDLSRTISRRIAVPPSAVSARLIATRQDSTAWGGDITVESIDGPLSSTVSIADPGTTVHSGVAVVGVDELDGVSELMFIPPASGDGVVAIKAVFTVSVPESPAFAGEG